MVPERIQHEVLGSPKIIPFSVLESRPLTLVEIGWHRDLFSKQAKIILEKAEQKWQSPKAIVNELSGLFPKEQRLLQKIFKKDDENGLRKALSAVLNHRYPGLEENSWVGLRTCFAKQPLGQPWIMGINRPEQVEDFLKPSDQAPTTWQGTPDHYPEWRKYEDLTEIIVMTNPPQLGLSENEKDFFVFRIFLYQNQDYFPQTQMAVALMPHTSQLRDLDRGTRTSSIIYIEPENNQYDPLAKEQKLSISFGTDYLQENQIDPEIKALAKETSQTVFAKWSENLRLYPRLLALQNIGLEAIEFQGIKGKNPGILYGFRGIREYRPS